MYLQAFRMSKKVVLSSENYYLIYVKSIQKTTIPYIICVIYMTCFKFACQFITPVLIKQS